jgi:hypothetical protein
MTIGPSVAAVAVCRFVIATPSRRVGLSRGQRERAVAPLHPRSWGCRRTCSAISWRGSRGDAGRGTRVPVPYDPAVYAGVYQRVLRHRNTELVGLDVILPTERLSVYDFAVAPRDLVPTPAEAERFVHEVERRYPDPGVLDAEIAGWWET